MKRTLLLIAVLGILPAVASAETVVGINLSTPLLVSGTAGFTLGGDPATQPVPMIEVEAGMGGGRILAGLDGSGQSVGFGVKAALMRTWFEPVEVDEDQLYMGVELQANAGKLIGSLGGYYNIDGDDDSFITTLSLGLRF